MFKVTVEPVILFYTITYMLSNNLATNLLLYKTCDPTGAIRMIAGSKCDREAEAQHVVASINVWKLFILQAVPVAVSLVACTWSDQHGRRRRSIIMLPIVGQILADVMSLYCTVNWSVSPQLSAALQAVAIAFTGSIPLMANGLNIYIADTTPEKWLTVKFGVFNATGLLGYILGMVIYGTLITYVGIVTAYLVAIGLGLVTLALLFVFIKNPTTKTNAVEDALSDPKPIVAKSYSLYLDVLHTVNPMNIFRSCYHVLTKRRDKNKSVVLWLAVLICAPLTCVPKEGEMTVLYLFLRYKFQWNEADFSMFLIYLFTIVSLGTIFVLGLLSHTFGMNDALIGAIATIFDLLSTVGFLLASQSLHLYFVAPIQLFHGAALSLTSSIASKCVGSDELGAMNAIKLLMEGIFKTIFIPSYSFVYDNTLESMPSAFFFISIILISPLIFVFFYIYFLNRNHGQ